MNCRDCQKKLSDYVDERLDDSGRQQVDAHRRECTACEQSYRAMQRVAQVLASDGPAQPRVGLADRAARAAFAAGQTAPTRSFFDRWIPVAWPTAAVAAAAAVLLLVTTPVASRDAATAATDPIGIVMDDATAADEFDDDVLGVEAEYEE